MSVLNHWVGAVDAKPKPVVGAVDASPKPLDAAVDASPKPLVVAVGTIYSTKTAMVVSHILYMVVMCQPLRVS